jgi:N,N'-diacetyllegionaminate synthase
MLKRLELSPAMHEKLIAHAAKRGIEFFSTAFDLDSLDYLLGLGMSRIKVPSGELTNLPYLRKVGSTGNPVILSTGMANLGEIEAALAALEAAGTPRRQITVLHCSTEYPAPMAEVNLQAMPVMARAFGVQVGYSDHTEGIEVAIAAVAMGASVIEKHFTLDRALPGPDHWRSETASSDLRPVKRKTDWWRASPYLPPVRLPRVNYSRSRTLWQSVLVRVFRPCDWMSCWVEQLRGTL